MKYYLIAGEASGDLHASRLMHSLKEQDAEATFRFIGGDMMATEGGKPFRHYKDLAYMGFIPVLLHARTILRNMAQCKEDIMRWTPDVVILVDYPGFNLSIAKFVHAKVGTPVFYYISPKIWAWKEWRIKAIRRDVNELFSILPFEVDFFERKHHYPIHYVGNPTAEEVKTFRDNYHESKEAFCQRHGLDAKCPVLALLAGSRKQEIKDNLPTMITAALPYCKGEKGYQMVLAGAPSIDDDYYSRILKGQPVTKVSEETYQLLSHATSALVTSGTATLETALLGVPQVVCYKTPVGPLIRWAFNHIIQCRFISLVNLIADKEIVTELFADRFSVKNIRHELNRIHPGQPDRATMLQGYQLVAERLGKQSAPDTAAKEMIEILKQKDQ